MDVSRYVTESAVFTHATLFGKPARWLVFILLGLPLTALTALLESRKILDKNIVRWDLIPWNEAGLLIALGVLCNLLVSGWIVRLLRDDPVPPEFDRPFQLCLDGMKFHVIPLVWMLVPSVLAFVQFSIAGGNTVFVTLWPPDPAGIVLLLLLAIQVVIVLYAVQYGFIGAVRFARTGSVREAFALLAIKRTFNRIGFVNYFIGIGVITLVWILFSLSLRGIAFLPVAGPIISLCLSPVPTVYCFRFIAHFCDEDRLPAGEERGKAADAPSAEPLTIREWIQEYAAWLLILAVLVVLCFTPIALIAASLVRLMP